MNRRDVLKSIASVGGLGLKVSRIKVLLLALYMAVVVLPILPSMAANVLLTNDDGMNTANTMAVYRALKAGGHDVVVVTPFDNQSGKSASIVWGKAIPPIEKEAHGIPAGAPGVGNDPKNADVSYVNSTPAVATIYGLDIVASARWNGPPDLVVSGPNHGNNVGDFTLYSGTVGAASVAARRGVPALAVSAPS